MHRFLTPLALALLALPPPTALAQDAAKGARLYLGLPAGEASCVECHGPDPGLDRNRLLNAARGPAAIDEALRKAAAMGYLAELLTPVDRADLSAFLALVSAEAEGTTPAQAWPWGLEFGRVTPGAALAPQAVRLHNRSAGALPLAPRLLELVPGGAAGLSLGHDCPALLPAGAACTLRLGLVAAGEGRVLAALDWGDGGAALRPVGVAATVGAGPAAVAGWRDAAATELDGVVRLQAPARAEATATLLLRNDGVVPMVLGVPAITGPGRAAFWLEAGAGACAANAVLAPGAECAVRLRARAPDSGVAEAALQWRNDGVHAPLRRLEVRALAAAPPVAAPPPAVVPPGTAPAPVPVPSPAPVATGGGGCSRMAVSPGRLDPLLPGLVLLAVAVLALRARRGQPASPA
jgi:hypothetical protein